MLMLMLIDKLQGASEFYTKKYQKLTFKSKLWYIRFKKM